MIDWMRTKPAGRVTMRPMLEIASTLTAIAVLGTHVWAEELISIPLQHVATNDDKYNALGILVGVNDGAPRLFQFDTGSDEFNVQIDADITGVSATHGSKPGMYAYGNGTYGYWMQEVRFDSLSYYDPADPSRPVATLDGGYVAGRILDWVYTAGHNLSDYNVTSKPIGHHNGMAVYADLDVRERIQNGEPSDTPPFYGTFGASDNLGAGITTSALGGRTKTGYVVAANTNFGDTGTAGCAPCLLLNLTPGIRAQFSALVPWGKLDYDGYQRKFPQSGAHASTQFEGAYKYTISIDIGQKKRAVDFTGPLLLDTGTQEFIYTSEDHVLNKLKAKGLRLDTYSDETVDIKLYGFADTLDDIEFDDVDISRLSDEDAGKGLILGLPFFQRNAVMYDLENRLTAYTPYFVTANDFTTDGSSAERSELNEITSQSGSSGWFGLAGQVSGEAGLTIQEDAVVRMTNTNSYTGETHVAAGGYLYLAGLGSIEQSSRVLVDGHLNIEQKGNYLAAWGVGQSDNDALIRNLNGAGEVYLGDRRLIITEADGQFEGAIEDYDDDGESMHGGLLLAGGTLTLAGDNGYTGITEVAAGAELRVTGSLMGDVIVHGSLVVDGTISGDIRVEDGGSLAGAGQVGGITMADGS